MGRLVLTRKQGESIIAGDIVITIEALSEKRCSISFEAPDDVRIDRKEIADARAAKLASEDAEQQRRLKEQRDRQNALDAEYWIRRGF